MDASYSVIICYYSNFGDHKIVKEKDDGIIELGFGIFLMLLIGGSYWFLSDEIF